MGATIRTLLDGNDDFIYPKTKTVAVYDENNNTLDQMLTPLLRGKNEQGTTPISDPNLLRSDIEQEVSTSTIKVPSSNLVKGLSDNLGSPSSASSVTGSDAFSKISTLNSDLAAENWVEIFPTFNSDTVASGTLKAYRNKHFCCVNMSGVVFKAAGDNQTIVTGLPVAQVMISNVFVGANGSESRLIVAQADCAWISAANTVIQSHIGTTYNKQHWASFVYPITS